MTQKIALLRGVNVGGRNKLPMKELRALLEKTGCENVRTYIQSGNIVFSGRATGDVIGAAIEKKFGFRPAVMVMTLAAFKKAAANCPFKAQADAAPKNVHLYFLQKAPPENAVADLNVVKAASEDFALEGRVMYLLTPDGLMSSKIAEKTDRILKANATARNWNTVRAILALAEQS